MSKKEKPVKSLMDIYDTAVKEIATDLAKGGFTEYQIRRVITKMNKWGPKTVYHLDNRQEKVLYPLIIRSLSTTFATLQQEREAKAEVEATKAE